MTQQGSIANGDAVLDELIRRVRATLTEQKPQALAEEAETLKAGLLPIRNRLSRVVGWIISNSVKVHLYNSVVSWIAEKADDQTVAKLDHCVGVV